MKNFLKRLYPLQLLRLIKTPSTFHSDIDYNICVPEWNRKLVTYFEALDHGQEASEARWEIFGFRLLIKKSNLPNAGILDKSPNIL